MATRWQVSQLITITTSEMQSTDQRMKPRTPRSDATSRAQSHPAQSSTAGSRAWLRTTASHHCGVLGVDLRVRAPFTPASLNLHLLPSGPPTMSLSPQKWTGWTRSRRSTSPRAPSHGRRLWRPLPHLRDRENGVTTYFMAPMWELNGLIYTTHLAERRPCACNHPYYC